MRLLVHGLAGCSKGGIETFVLGMAEHMSDNIIFDYVIEKDESVLSEIIMPGNGDTLVIYPKKHILLNLKSWSTILDKRRKIDSAIYFNWYSMAWLFPAIMARLKGYRVIIHAHNNNLHNCSLLQRALHSINRQVQKLMRITRLTNSILSARFFFGEKPAEMIYNAIDIDKFSFNKEVRIRMRNNLSIGEKHVYGFAGRIAYQKNPLFLIDIFNEIKKKDKDAAFLVCGDGDMMSETKKRADGYGLDILFVGAVSNLQEYYQAMDVFLLPSKFEGLGIVLIEAQCCGLPCLASADVIPKDAKVTDLLEFINLRKNPEEWAERAIGLNNNRRDAYASFIANSRFNIVDESKRLEEVLTGKNILSK